MTWLFHFQDVSNNELSELPKYIGLLSRLFRLNVSNNRLSSLPPEIGAMDCKFEHYYWNNHLPYFVKTRCTILGKKKKKKNYCLGFHGQNFLFFFRIYFLCLFFLKFKKKSFESWGFELCRVKKKTPNIHVFLAFSE